MRSPRELPSLYSVSLNPFQNIYPLVQEAHLTSSNFTVYGTLGLRDAQSRIPFIRLDFVSITFHKVHIYFSDPTNSRCPICLTIKVDIHVVYILIRTVKTILPFFTLGIKVEWLELEIKTIKCAMHLCTSHVILPAIDSHLHAWTINQ